MNIQTVRTDIRNFITARIPIYSWDLDYPDVHYFTYRGTDVVAATAIELPAMSLKNQRGTAKNNVLTTVKLPYRITYIFPDSPFSEIPLKALEGLLSNLQIYAIRQPPNPDILVFEVADEEDSVTVERCGDESNDWLVNLNFSFLAIFNTTELADITDLFPDNDDEVTPVTSLRISVNRAKPEFQRSDTSTYVLDTNIDISINP